MCIGIHNRNILGHPVGCEQKLSVYAEGHHLGPYAFGTECTLICKILHIYYVNAARRHLGNPHLVLLGYVCNFHKHLFLLIFGREFNSLHLFEALCCKYIYSIVHKKGGGKKLPVGRELNRLGMHTCLKSLHMFKRTYGLLKLYLKHADPAADVHCNFFIIITFCGKQQLPCSGLNITLFQKLCYLYGFNLLSVYCESVGWREYLKQYTSPGRREFTAGGNCDEKK